MGEAEPKRMSVEEFFEWQLRQDRNYELVHGVPVLTVKAMTGASRQHDYVTVNAIAEFSNRLKGKPCRPSTSDQSVLTHVGARRPDLTIECGSFDPKSMFAGDPRLVMEVLSPSTMRFDRFQKVEEYKQVGAIQVIMLVDSESPQVTVLRRERNWDPELFRGLNATIPLPELDIGLPLSELFADLTFEENAPVD